MSYEVTLLIFGILLLLVGLVGRVKAKELEIGTSSKMVRLVLSLLGIALLVLSFNPDIVKNFLSGPETPLVVNGRPETQPEPQTEPEPRPAEDLNGEYRIRVKATNRYLHEDGWGDKLVSTRHQVDDDFTRFFFESEPDGSYRIRVKANNRYLHEDGLGDKLLSTRAQEHDDFTRFFLEPEPEGSYRIRVKADGRYLHVDGLGDKLVSTRHVTSDDFTRFFLER